MTTTRDLFQRVEYVVMIDCRSFEAASGVRFVQKYWSELRPTTGMPLPAITRAIDLSIDAQPPSPETKTTSVSDVPCVTGTSTRGSESKVARMRNIGLDHLATTPRSPPAINAARLVNIRGSARPPGDARYVGSHT